MTTLVLKLIGRERGCIRPTHTELCTIRLKTRTPYSCQARLRSSWCSLCKTDLQNIQAHIWARAETWPWKTPDQGYFLCMKPKSSEWVRRRRSRYWPLWSWSLRANSFIYEAFSDSIWEVAYAESGTNDSQVPKWPPSFVKLRLRANVEGTTLRSFHWSITVQM